jgi:tryptophan-rich sensory protein
MNKLLLINIVLPILAALIINYIIYYKGWSERYKKDDKEKEIELLPPGYIIGLIWMILFGLLGYINYRLYKLKNKINFGNILVVFFILFSLAYPFLTFGLNKKYGLLLNYVTLLLSFILSLVIVLYSIKIFMYLIPLLLWVFYVNYVFIVLCSKIIETN